MILLFNSNVGLALEEIAIYADNSVVGSCFKPDGQTKLPIKSQLVEEFMGVVRQVRSDRY